MSRRSSGQLVADHIEVTKAARRLRGAISLAASALLLIFAWLQFSRAEVLSAVASVPAKLVFRTTLVLYFTAWVFGSRSDLDALEIVLPRPPKKFGLPDLWIVALFALGFGALCWANTPRRFVILLAVFWTIDYLSVRLRLAKLVTESTARAIEIAGGDLAETIRIRAVLDQVCGSWRWSRFYAGYVCILALALLVFAHGASFLATLLNERMPFSEDLVIAVAILAFVVLVELWMWKHRLGRAAIMRAVEDGLATQSIASKRKHP